MPVSVWFLCCCICFAVLLLLLLVLSGRRWNRVSVTVSGAGSCLKETPGPLWVPQWIALCRPRHGYRAPIPPFTNRDRIGARNVGWFVEGGRLDYQSFRQAIERHTADPLPALSVLCLFYTSDAADERSSVDLGGPRIIKKTKK